MERKHKMDTLLLLITLVLIAIGLIMVLSSSSYDGLINYDNPLFYFSKQMLIGAGGIGLMLWGAAFPMEHLRKCAVPAFLTIMAMLVFTLFFGVEVNGSRRWLKIAGFQFAPAELAKPIFVIFYAHLLTVLGKKRIQKIGWFLFCSGMLIVMVLPIVIEDLGTGVIVFATLFGMLAIAGARTSHLAALVIISFLGGCAAIGMSSYRMDRIHYWLDPYDDPMKKGYQAIQSFYAIGSGGLFGVGLGAGIQKLLILPEQQTDMIFSVIAEEMGFVGAGFVILLFALFLWRGMLAAFQLKDKFKQFTAFGLTTYIVVQAAINIAVTVGFFPITGVPLPFISYGRTSFLFVAITVGLLLGLTRYTIEPKEKD